MMPRNSTTRQTVSHSVILITRKSLLAEWVTAHVGADWITDLAKIRNLLFMQKMSRLSRIHEHQIPVKVRLAEYILEHNGVS